MPVWDENDHRHGNEEEWAFKSRTFTGQIVGVDEEKGQLSVRIRGIREKFEVDAPVFGLSVRGVSSSWMRHMPQVRDWVNLSFGPDNRPRLHRVTTFRPESDSGGWADIARAAAANDGNLGLVWRKLRQGEFDLRSSGGAGYHFAADGHAEISAGPTGLLLDKRRDEGRGQAGLWVQAGDGVEVRLGNVKRLLPASFEETPVVLPNPTAAAAKEWKRVVAYGVPPLGLPVLSLDVDEAGDVRDGLGVPVVGPYGVPLRSRRRWYDPSGLVEALTVEVDAVGQVKVTQGALAAVGGIAVSAPACPVTVTALRSTYEALTTNVVGSALPAAGVFLGSATAFEPLVKGTTFATALVPQVVGQTVLYGALAAFMAAYLTENPTKPSGLASTAVAGACAALAGLSGALTGAMVPGAALSLKVLTE